jgi:adenine-specific DNA-methyltransferase
MFNLKIFNNPKPIELIKDIVFLGSKKDSIILDFFAGSGTTAHAVMELNRQDGGIIKIVINHLMIPLKIGNILI